MTDVSGAIRKLENAKAKVSSATRDGVEESERLIIRKVRSNIHSRSGRLASSIHGTEPEDVEDDWVAEVSPNTVYARIQEEGGEIVPRDRHYLRWFSGGKIHFATHVHIPGTHYFKRGVEGSRSEIVEIFRSSIEEALGG